MTAPRRIAFLTFGAGIYDARTLRMARTARAAGYAVTIYARWYRGLPVHEERDGIRIVRAPFDWRLAVPGMRANAFRRISDAMDGVALRRRRGAFGRRRPPVTRRMTAALPGPLRHRVRRWWRMLRLFPMYGLGWAAALERVVEPADVWHGMWAGSLPALTMVRRRFGGRTVYDSRDVYMRSRSLATAGRAWRLILGHLERRWVRQVDRVMTVNSAYARLLTEQLRIEPPLVVMNLPDLWAVERCPDLIREALALPSSSAIVLYQGGLMTDRGIEPAMEAILDVPGAVLCLLGFGSLRDELIAMTAIEPYAGKVFVLDPVPPDALLEWTASADVSVMAIQPTSQNHLYTTPQKLFESIAVGVPVVASDLPGMAEVVLATQSGILCDPTDPSAIARAIRELLEVPAEVKAARRERILAAARSRYNWQAEEATLLGLYAELAPDSADATPREAEASGSEASPAGAAARRRRAARAGGRSRIDR